MAKPNRWTKEQLFGLAGPEPVVRKGPTHSFHITAYPVKGTFVPVTMIQGNNEYEIPSLISTRIAELFTNDSDNSVSLDDALLYAAAQYNLTGDILVMIGRAR